MMTRAMEFAAVTVRALPGEPAKLNQFLSPRLRAARATAGSI
jgi:hypothetical protein